MATKFSVEDWDQLKADLVTIEGFDEKQARWWLERHGYGPTLAAEAMDKRVLELVEIVEVVEEYQTKKEKKSFF